ncbi:NADH-quinone oxidoreductase subunit L [Pseudonocardia sp. KRD-184]|uniref:NADH-quinone oxidoreductase subunit L n=1 Tax=Pseudonocardia oceani TaxID=2792013 RepID=A0ABS6UH92_9PSEU|nr:proton-conducting transporter membrane subunit [Pseudonocardia oceani]MBW0090321.1 NADH-quinone oxidoreductase subunit L [Pseudonocardia oceani]MBW0097493.1 NADH-quinone oxidoreductase subunit L [Pseudonocardia oceani]MBW0112174.1 NADH-quinone oxidoreductase subunit L [Pseudonocardia oceani]MBW0123496.1 NADH-quinone oxidoreductase subunit L [Pseudonocardia oceani]MBW0131276.1 NADH-quinone oxidoreductase subunit L [Pseudonocardia oceani]
MSTVAGPAALWLLVALPAAAGAALALAGHRADRVAVPVSLGTAAAGVGLGAAVAVARPAVSVPFLAGAPFALGVDALSALVLPTVALVALLVLVFSAGYRGDAVPAAPARFHGLMLLFASAVGLTATATTLPALLVGWEVMGAASYALIGFAWRDPARPAAGATAFLTTRAADLGLYAAAAAALAGGGGLALDALADAEGGWLHVAAAGVLVAALGKAAQLPFAFWLSRAMQGPSPVSALLHSASMVAMGGYLLLRTSPLLAAAGWAATTAAWVGAVTALLLGAVALAQRDLKQLLAASTSAQLGFVVLAAGLSAVGGGAAHLVAHAATKALLFLVAGAWLAALGTRRLQSLRGAARRWPLVGACAAAGALALAGVAPLSLWATKEAVLSAALHRSPALYVVGVAAAALSAAYAGKVLVLVVRPAPAGVEAGYDTEERGTRRVPAVEQTPLVVLAAGAAVLGVLALPPVAGPLGAALGSGGAPAPGAAELAGSALLALVVLAAVTLRPRAVAGWSPAWAAGWLGLETAVGAAVVRPVLAVAAALARFDDRVHDRAVAGAGRATLAAGRTAARIGERGLDRAVGAAARGGLAVGRATARADRDGVAAAVHAASAGVHRLGSAARRSQTGQVHQYFLQAAAVLVAAVALLVIVG